MIRKEFSKKTKWDEGRLFSGRMSRLVLGTLVGVLIASPLALLHFSLGETVDIQVESRGASVPPAILNDKVQQGILDVANVSLIPQTTNLIAQLSSKSRNGRLIVLHRLFENIDSAEQLEEFLRELRNTDDDQIRNEIEKVAIRRLANLEPLAALVQVDQSLESKRNPLLDIVFQEWSAADLDTAITHSSSLEKADRLSALTAMLAFRYDLSESDLFGIAIRFHGDQAANDSVALSMIAKPINDPPLAWQTFVSIYGNDINALSEVQFRQLGHIALNWWEMSGVDAIHAIVESLETNSSRDIIVGELLETIAVSYPREALRIALETPQLKDTSIVLRVIEKWASSDGFSAIQATSTINNEDLRKHAQNSAIAIWGATNPNSLLQALNALPQKLRLIAQESAIENLSKVAPEAAAELLEDVSDTTTLKRLALTIASNWAHSDPISAFSWSATATNIQNVRFDVQSRIVRNVAWHDPRLALTLAKDQPIEENEIGLESIVFATIAYLDAQEAFELLAEARNQATREAAYPDIGARLIREGKSDQAIELANVLSRSNKLEYFRSIRLEWAWHEPQDLFEQLDNLPSEEVRQALAVTLTMANDFHQTLTLDQRRKLKSILPEMYWQVLDAW